MDRGSQAKLATQEPDGIRSQAVSGLCSDSGSWSVLILLAKSPRAPRRGPPPAAARTAGGACARAWSPATWRRAGAPSAPRPSSDGRDGPAPGPGGWGRSAAGDAGSTAPLSGAIVVTLRQRPGARRTSPAVSKLTMSQKVLAMVAHEGHLFSYVSFDARIPARYASSSPSSRADFHNHSNQCA
jgi:hypothetical protein